MTLSRLFCFAVL